MRSNIVVIGGGIVGLCSALRLQQAGFAVTIIDDDIIRSAASWGNAGHIAIEQVEPLASRAMIRSAPQRLFARGGALSLPPSQVGRWLPFAARMWQASSPPRFAAGRRALTALLADAMPAWQRLVGDIGQPGLLRADGHYIVWESAATAAAGRAKWRAADTGTARFRDADADEIEQLTRLTGRHPAGAIRFENSGQITSPTALDSGLERAFRAAGGIIRRGHARLNRNDRRVWPVLDDGTLIAADLVIVAAGVRSELMMESVDHPVPIIAERGYHIQSPSHSWPPTMPPVVFEDRSMIVTAFAEGLRAASFVEFAGVDTPPDRRKWRRLEAHVAALGLPVDAPFTQWIGARPTLPDYLPAIGRSDRTSNLIYAFGHQHLGLTLAPVTAELVTALALAQRPRIDLTPFDIDRFKAKAHRS